MLQKAQGGADTCRLASIKEKEKNPWPSVLSGPLGVFSVYLSRHLYLFGFKSHKGG